MWGPKAAAMSETDRSITIDADNIVREDFFNNELNMSRVTDTDVISWAGKNTVNGLVYGNGGIKCCPWMLLIEWYTRSGLKVIKQVQVDFCWNIPLYPK